MDEKCVDRIENRSASLIASFLVYSRVDHLYAFFLRWSPERALDPSLNDDYPDNSNTSNRHASHTQSKHHEISSGKGFVLLANDDPELTDDDYLSTNNNSRSRTPTTSSDSGMQTKKQHYLKRQNTLLKEWEVMNKKKDLFLIERVRRLMFFE